MHRTIPSRKARNCQHITWEVSFQLLAMKVGLLQGLADVEVRALAQHDCPAQAGDAVGWTGDEVVLSCFPAHWPCLGY